MKDLERRAGQRILYEVRALGGQYLSIAESATYLTLNRQETIARENTFASIIETLSTTQNNSDAYRYVRTLRTLTQDELFPTLGQIVSDCDQLAQQTLQEATAEYPEWANKQFPSRGTPVWGMIIEGYGKYLGKRFGKEDERKRKEISRAFVLAFESVLFVEHKESALLTDVLEWMRDEKDDFPQEIAEQL